MESSDTVALKAHAIWLNPLGRPPTLAARYEHGADNFLLLRFLAAAVVIFGHSYALCGLPNQADFIARAGLGKDIYTDSIAVDIFFVVSGFLVTGSYLNRANLLVFIRARALRILPAYAVCVLLCAYLLGAIFTELPLRDYWLATETWNYVYVNMQFGTNLVWNLPGVFIHNFYPKAVNGSIWTLPAEVRMYGWVAILGASGALRKRWLANLVLAALVLLGMSAPDYLPLVPKPVYLPLACYFLAGGFCFINRDWIPLSSLLALALVALAIVAAHTVSFPFLLGIALVYLSLWFAYVPNFHFFNRFGDYSYGLYLWGFPVQQALTSAVGPMPAWANFALSLPITLALAALSWHLIEKPALRWKKGDKSLSSESASRELGQLAEIKIRDVIVTTKAPATIPISDA